jgi:uncharacterized OB-fold protein
MLPFIDFPVGHDSRRLRPLISTDARPHYDGLERGALLLLRCDQCLRMRLPAAPLCTWCGCDAAAWQPASGRGRVHSWVRYQRGFLTEFEALLPYVVLAVQLEEGPVLFGRLVTPAATPEIGQPTRTVVERWADGFCAPAFALDEVAP